MTKRSASLSMRKRSQEVVRTGRVLLKDVLQYAERGRVRKALVEVSGLVWVALDARPYLTEVFV